MRRLWPHITRPMVDTIEVRTIIEIGSEHGTGTKAIANYARHRRAILHAIDPAPTFNVNALRQEFAEHLVYHVGLSLNVLPALGRFDVALIDGDHNWYTVYHELKLIEAAHQDDPARYPLLFFHDVGWPYGRRDLYYDIDTIPEHGRQPSARGGIVPNQSALQADNGLNPELLHAIHEGGPRNGVRTAIDDFMSESGVDLDFLFLPILYGFGAMVSKARLDAEPKLRQAFDYWRGADGLFRICELTEKFRIASDIMLQSAVRKLEAKDRGASGN